MSFRFIAILLFISLTHVQAAFEYYSMNPSHKFGGGYFLTQNQFFLSQTRLYGIKGLTCDQGLLYTSQSRIVALINYYSLGYKSYRETVTSLGIGIPFHHRFKIMPALQQYTVAIQSYGSIRRYGMSIEMLYRGSPHLSWKLFLGNITGASLGKHREPIPQTVEMQIHFKVHTTTTVIYDWAHDISNGYEPGTSSIHISAKIWHQLFFSGGYRHYPVQMHGGIDIRTKTVFVFYRHQYNESIQRFSSFMGIGLGF